MAAKHPLRPVVVAACAAVLIVLTGASGLALSLLSYQQVVSGFIQPSFPDTAAKFTQVMYLGIMSRLRIVSVCVLFIGLVLLWKRGTLATLAGKAFRLAAGGYRTACVDVRGWLRHEPPSHLACLGLICISAFCIRFIYLHQPIRYDEAYTYLAFASKPLPIALSFYDAPNNHLFHTLLVHLSTAMFGGDPWAIRVPAFVAGVLLIPAVYWAGIILYNKTAALLSAGLTAASMPMVFYSANGRGYALVSLCTVLLLGLSALLIRSRRPCWWPWFAICGAIGFHTIPVMLYPFTAISLWLLLSFLIQVPSNERSGLLRQWLWTHFAMGVLILSLYLPVIVVSGPTALLGNRFVEASSLVAVLSQASGFLAALLDAWTTALPLPVQIALFAGLGLATVMPHRAGRFRVPLFIPLLLGTCLIMLLHPKLKYIRLFHSYLPLLLLSASGGLVALIPRTFAVFRTRILDTAVVLLTAGLLFNLHASKSVTSNTDTGSFRDAETVALFLDKQLQPGDHVLLSAPSDAPLGYYLRRYGVRLNTLLADTKKAQRIFVVVNMDEHQTLEQVIESQQDHVDMPFLLRSSHLVATFDNAVVFEIDLTTTDGQPTDADRSGAPVPFFQDGRSLIHTPSRFV